MLFQVFILALFLLNEICVNIGNDRVHFGINIS